MAEFDYSKLRSCGQDVYISGNVEIRRPHLVTVGSHVAIDSGFYCTVGAEFGDYLHVGPYITIIGGEHGLFRMGHFTTIGAGSRLICVSDMFDGEGLVSTIIPDHVRGALVEGPIVMENFSNLGTNVVVYPNITIGEGSVVGSCSLLTKDTEPWVVYVGIPAKPLKLRKRAMKEKAKLLGYEL